MQTFPAISSEELAALLRFANDNGRRWKSQLSDIYWYNARIWRGEDGRDDSVGYVLHGLRNSHGPAWLDTFKLPSAENDWRVEFLSRRLALHDLKPGVRIICNGWPMTITQVHSGQLAGMVDCLRRGGPVTVSASILVRCQHQIDPLAYF
jgi:hypothetical protein